MADIFISYSKADHALALKLSTFLEAEGWSVWWDKSLGAADLYRDEIMKQLAAARAVISIWTSNSIRSEWVAAEAGRAKADGKLIPVKTPDVAYGDIPLPFGEMHTENVASTDLIRAAVKLQLDKPAVQPTAWALLTKGSKSEILTWVGIVGGALTLFGNLEAVLRLAEWARLLVQNWKAWTHAFWLWAFGAFWLWAFGWLGIHLPPEWTPVLGQAVQFKRTAKNQLIEDKYQGKSFRLRTALMVGILIVISMIAWLVLITILFENDTPLINTGNRTLDVLIYFLLPQFILTIGFARNKLNAGVSICLMNIFWIIIALNDLFFPKEDIPPSFNPWPLNFAVVMISILPIIVLSVAPAKAVSRRLIFLAIGLILLIALNELSKLGLDVVAPKPHGPFQLCCLT